MGDDVKNLLPKSGYKRLLVIIVYTVIVLTFTFISLKIIQKYLLPFIIAWLIVLLTEPITTYLSAKTRIPYRVISFTVLTVIFAIFALISVYIVTRLFREARELVGYFTDSSEAITQKILTLIEKARQKLHLDSNESSKYIEDIITDSVKTTFGELSMGIAGLAKKAAYKLPSFFFTLFIFIFASYYICMNISFVNDYILSLFPKRVARRLENFKNKAVKSSAKIFRAYLILMLLTFAELYTSFIILKVKYAAMAAFIIALLDILPAIGVGTILLPWAVISLISGNTKMFISLLLLYGIIAIIRQIAEPHIVGAQLGLHPLAALVSVYIGFKAAGVTGLIIAPFTALAVKKGLDLLIEYRKKRETV